MGDWDLYRRFAQEYGWTPDVVDALDPAFVDEQCVVWAAMAEFEKRPKPTVKGSR